MTGPATGAPLDQFSIVQRRTRPTRPTRATQDRRLSVLHVAPYLWSGAGRVITQLVESQIPGHTVGIVTSPRRGALANWPAYDRRLADMGVWRARIDTFRRDTASFWTAVTAMRQVIEQFAPDVIHTHAGTPTAVALLARSATSRPTTPVLAHFYSWGLGRPAWMNDMDLWAFARAELAVCSAHAYHGRLTAGGVDARRLRLVPWGLPESIAVAPATPVTDREAPVIGTVGRVERRKGQHELVRAFARLVARWPRARLEIVGPFAEQSYAAEIHRTIDQLQLGGCVRLTGRVTSPRTHVSRWSAYVSLSRDEGQGLAVLEAMACGVPIIARRAAGIEDYLVDGRTGLVAPTASARVIAGLIHRLLADPLLAKKLSTAASHMVRRRYSWEKTVARVEAMYRELIRRRIARSP